MTSKWIHPQVLTSQGKEFEQKNAKVRSTTYCADRSRATESGLAATTESILNSDGCVLTSAMSIYEENIAGSPITGDPSASKKVGHWLENLKIFDENASLGRRGTSVTS